VRKYLITGAPLRKMIGEGKRRIGREERLALQKSTKERGMNPAFRLRTIREEKTKRKNEISRSIRI